MGYLAAADKPVASTARDAALVAEAGNGDVDPPHWPDVLFVNSSNAGLDLQLRYALSRNASFVFQAQNITNNKPARLTVPFVNIYGETLENGRSFFAEFNLKFN